MSVTLKRLEPFQTHVPKLPGYQGAESMAGTWEGLRFIVTRDHDGQIEASLSNEDRSRVSRNRAKAFFKMWGVKPFSDRQDMTLSCHWIIQRADMQ